MLQIDAVAYATGEGTEIFVANTDESDYVEVARYAGSWLSYSIEAAVGLPTSVSIDVDAGGVPYVAFYEQATSTALKCYRYESEWTSLTLERDQLPDDAYALDVACHGTHWYLMFSDATNGGRATVLEDGTWKAEYVISDGAANASRLVSANGNLYAAFRDEHNGGGATVMKKEGDQWVTLGTAGFTGEIADDKSICGARLALHVTPSGEIVLAYPVMNNDDGATVTIKVMRYHE
jgi:hypothetical protein